MRKFKSLAKTQFLFKIREISCYLCGTIFFCYFFCLKGLKDVNFERPSIYKVTCLIHNGILYPLSNKFEMSHFVGHVNSTINCLFYFLLHFYLYSVFGNILTNYFMKESLQPFDHCSKM